MVLKRQNRHPTIKQVTDMKTRRTIALILAAVLVFALAACGNASKNTAAGGTQNSANTTANTDPADSSTITVPVEGQTGSDGSASENFESQTNDPATEDTGTRILVVYFSATGTTKGVAERIAKMTHADIYEIVPVQPYTKEDLNYNDKSTRATKEQNDPAARPAIGSADISLDDYTTVFIGYPIWWGDAPRIMSTFVESHDFDGKVVIPFCTSGSSGIGNSGSDLAAKAGSGKWLDGARFAGSVTDEKLKEWISGQLQ